MPSGMYRRIENRLSLGRYMFGKPFRLFRLFGFNVKADPSWLVVVALVVWTISVQFRGMYPGLPEPFYWSLGVMGAVGLFGSIVLHELAHALVARRFDMPIRGITLFIFGGVAEMESEPPTAKSEFWVAIAGPIMSALLGLLFIFGLAPLGRATGMPLPLQTLITHIGVMNLILVAFNIIPAFPLDGGRVLRSILWALRNNLSWATKITSTIGSLFGLALIALGVWMIIRGEGNIIQGLWLAFIGWFLRNAAAASYQQLLLRRALEGEPVSRFMTPNPVTAPSEITVKNFVENYMYRHHFKMFPVVDDQGNLIGCVTTKQLKDVPHEEWDVTIIREIAEGCSGRTTLRPDTDAMVALARMQRFGVGRMMVTDGDRLVGIFSIRDVMKLMQLRMELNDDNGSHPEDTPVHPSEAKAVRS